MFIHSIEIGYTEEWDAGTCNVYARTSVDSNGDPVWIGHITDLNTINVPDGVAQFQVELLTAYGYRTVGAFPTQEMALIALLHAHEMQFILAILPS